MALWLMVIICICMIHIYDPLTLTTASEFFRDISRESSGLNVAYW